MGSAIFKFPLRFTPDTGQRQACVDCLRQRLGTMPTVHFVRLAPGDAPVLEVGYDPAALILPPLKREPDCPGGLHPAARPNLCPLVDIFQRLERAQARRGRRAWQPATWLAWLAGQREMALVLAAGLALVAGFLAGAAGGTPALRFALLIASSACSSHQTVRLAWDVLRRARLNVDVLMFAAATGAACLGHYEAAVLLLFLFGLGTAGQHLALDRARGAIQAMSDLAPQTAHLLSSDGTTHPRPVESMAVGDRVLVRPYDRIPVDGQVLEGASSVDQSPLTGESVPVEKAAGDEAFAGTINGQGRLIVRVDRPASQTMLAGIVRMVEEAQLAKSPTQLFTQRIERWYVPAVFAATAVLIVAGPLAAGGSWSVWLYRAMAFLTAASPCALAIGTPAAVLCGVARGARDGVLIKGGLHLENLGAVGAVAFDKTGTLTTGQLTVSDVEAARGQDPKQVLALAASLESQSSHPLASAIVRAARTHRCKGEPASDVQQRAGVGVMGTVDGATVAVGNKHLLHSLTHADADAERRVDELAAQGKTIVVVLKNAMLIGWIALSDQPRPECRSALRRLHDLGVQRTVMLTGDNAAAAAAIGHAIGLDDQFAQLMPQDKLDRIRELEKRYGVVAMVGDGINDAPALAQATVGIALGAGAADVALESADVVLMSGGLGRLPWAIALSRFSRHIIAQNLVIAIGVIAVMAPLAAIGKAQLSFAVILHEGSTVLVVCNALRLLRFRKPDVDDDSGNVLE